MWYALLVSLSLAVALIAVIAGVRIHEARERRAAITANRSAAAKAAWARRKAGV